MTSFISFVQSLTGDWTSEGLFTDLPRSPRSINAPSWFDNVTIFCLFVQSLTCDQTNCLCDYVTILLEDLFRHVSVGGIHHNCTLKNSLSFVQSLTCDQTNCLCDSTSPYYCRTFSDIPQVCNFSQC